MRRLSPIALTLAALLAACPCRAQTQPSPLYSLPGDGTWVEYDWEHTPPGGATTKGTLRISSVGRKMIGQKAHRWVEIRLATKGGAESRVRYRKLLLSEGGLKRDRPLTEIVSACFDRRGDRVRSVTGKAWVEFLDMAVSERSLRELPRPEEVATKLGRYRTRHVVTDGAGQTRSYQGWLTDKVPFGWVRFEVHAADTLGNDRTLFTATAVRTGSGAVTEVDESVAK